MSTEKETEKSETAKPNKEELVDMVMTALKRNHNWKFLLGVLVGGLMGIYWL